MSHHEGSLPERLLAGDAAALSQVRRWVADFITAGRYWSLRHEWRDLHQEILHSLLKSLRRERFRADGEFRKYVWGICRNTALDRLAQQARRPAPGARIDEERIPVDARAEARMISEEVSWGGFIATGDWR